MSIILTGAAAGARTQEAHARAFELMKRCPVWQSVGPADTKTREEPRSCLLQLGEIDTGTLQKAMEMVQKEIHGSRYAPNWCDKAVVVNKFLFAVPENVPARLGKYGWRPSEDYACSIIDPAHPELGYSGIYPLECDSSGRLKLATRSEKEIMLGGWGGSANYNAIGEFNYLNCKYGRRKVNGVCD